MGDDGFLNRDAIAAKQAELDSTRKDLADAMQTMLAERPHTVADTVDIGVITANDAAFDDIAFATIARETYLTVREAWEQHNLQIADGCCTPEMLDEVRAAITEDAKASRIHVLPGIEIREAAITSAAVDGSRQTIVVRLALRGKDNFIDGTGAIVAGDDEYHDWSEDWTFVRDANEDATAEDRAKALIPEAAGGWDFAHQGWNVAAVTRV